MGRRDGRGRSVSIEDGPGETSCLCGTSSGCQRRPHRSESGRDGEGTEDRERDQRYLTAEQVTELADAVEQRISGGAQLVKLLSYGGLRWGEAVALRANNVDVLRRQVHVTGIGHPGQWQACLGFPEVASIPHDCATCIPDRRDGPDPLRGSPRVHVVGRPGSPLPEFLAKGVEARGGRPRPWRSGAARPATHCRKSGDFSRGKRESSAKNAGAFVGTDHS